MYRLLILYVAAAAAAPQDNSITYIKQQPEELLPAPSFASPLIESLTQDSEYADTKQTDEETSKADDAGREVQTTASTEDATFEESTETTEGTTVTERYVPKTTPKFKKAPPKFYSKLSYFEKPNFNSVSTNLVERTGRRQFRSRCRCEKISNCPKLQITVPRCPDEQFMCCF